MEGGTGATDWAGWGQTGRLGHQGVLQTPRTVAGEGQRQAWGVHRLEARLVMESVMFYG